MSGPDPFVDYWARLDDSRLRNVADPWIIIACPESAGFAHLHKRVSVLCGWPQAHPEYWLFGSDAIWWWSPLHMRRVVIVTGTHADDVVAEQVWPMIERQAPKRLVYRTG